MKTHFTIGFIIGAAINLAFQYTETVAPLDILELITCATVAGLAAFTAALLQRPTIYHGKRANAAGACHKSS